MNALASTAAYKPTPTTSIQWRDVVVYSSLAYAITWVFWIPQALPYLAHVLAGGAVPSDSGIGSMTGLTSLLPAFGPAIAALLMRLLVSREGIKGSLGIWRSWKYYLVAFVLPFVYIAALIAFENFTTIGHFFVPGERAAQLPVMYALIAGAGALLGLPILFGEEYGWRGYLLPKLLPLGEVKATLLLGIIWAAWHLPALVLGLNYPGQSLLLILPVWFLVVTALSFPFTWLYKASVGSVVITSLMHGVFNALGDNFTGVRTFPNDSPLLVQNLGLTSALVLVAIVLIVYGVFRRPVNSTNEPHPQFDGTWKDWLR